MQWKVVKGGKDTEGEKFTEEGGGEGDKEGNKDAE